MAPLRQIAFYGKGISASPQSPKCTRPNRTRLRQYWREHRVSMAFSPAFI